MNRLGLRYCQCLALAALAILAAPVSAQERAAVTTPQREHTVRRGDTLWDLAHTYLGNPFLWPMIYEANRKVVEDPHWIYPGEVLVIPGMAMPGNDVLGEPVLQQPEAAPADTVRTAVLTTVDLRRPLVPPAEYYSTPWVDAAPERPVLGRIVRIWSPSAEEDKIPAVLHPNYGVHIGQLKGAAAQPGDTLVSVRVGRELKGYGRIVEPLALLRVDSITGTTISATVVLQSGEATVGDRVIPLAELPVIPLGETAPVADGPAGQLVQFLVPQPLYGTGDLGFVSLGTGHLQVGDELAVYVPGRRIDKDRPDLLPPAEVARARVVRVSERTATVRLIRVMDTAVRDGLPVRLVGRAP